MIPKIKLLILAGFLLATVSLYARKYRVIPDEPFITYNSHYLSEGLAPQVLTPITILPNLNICIGSIIQVPVRVNQLAGVGSISLTLKYDPAKLEFQSATPSTTLPGFMAGATVPGTLKVSAIWGSTDPLLTLPDGSVLFTISFLFKGSPGMTNLTLFDDGTSCEYAAGPPEYTPFDDTQANFYINGSITRNPAPEITPGTSPVVDFGTTIANLPYSAATGNPDQYSIEFDAAANSRGFNDVTWTSLPASLIPITIPATPPAGTYNGTLKVRISSTGCESPGYPFTVTVRKNPTTYITDMSVCAGSVIQYPVYVNELSNVGSISLTLKYDPAKLEYQSATPSTTLPGFMAGATVPGTLKVSAIWGSTDPLLTLPDGSVLFTISFLFKGSPGATNLTWYDDGTSCEYAAGPPEYTPFDDTQANFYINGSITGNPVPAITLGTSPVVDFGTTTTNLPYSAATGNPDQYSIDFDAAANSKGFNDVIWTSLPASPIVITIPASPPAGIYNGTLKVRISSTGCESPGYPFTVTVRKNPTTYITNMSVCAGSVIQYPVYVNELSNVGSISLTLKYDPAKLEFQSATPSTTLPGFLAGATVPGTLKVSAIWGSTDPLLNLPDGSVLFTISFLFKGSPGTTNLTWYDDGTSCEYAAGPPEYTPFDDTQADFYINGSITGNPVPTITLGTSPVVDFGTTTTNLPYSAATGSPDQYSIDFDAAANSKGFNDVIWTSLPASPIVITIPASPPAGIYNGTLKVRISSTGCESPGYPFTVTVRKNPMTYITDMSVCAGSVIQYPVYVNELSNVGSISLTLKYDPAKLEFQSATPSTTLPGFMAGATVPGTLKVSAIWGSTDPLLTLPDGSVLFTISFLFKGSPGTTNLTWYDDGTSCEYAAGPPEYTPFDDTQSDFYINGSITGNLSCGVYLKDFLQGAYSILNHQMRTDLNSAGFLPKTQPYATTPLVYNGSESVSSFISDVVDWVVVELRTGTTPDTKVARQAALLLSNGNIVGTDQVNAPVFPGMTTGNYYVVIYHRNHLPVMTATAILLPNTSGTRHDFTVSPASNIYGSTNGVFPLESGVYGQVAGDINWDNRLKYSGEDNDKLNVFVIIQSKDTSPPTALNEICNGYYPEDTNMDGTVRYSGYENDPAIIFSNIDYFTNPTVYNTVWIGVVPVSY